MVPSFTRNAQESDRPVPPPGIDELLKKFNIDKSRYKRLDLGDRKYLEAALTCFAGQQIILKNTRGEPVKDENGRLQHTFHCFDDFKNGIGNLDQKVRSAFAMGSVEWVRSSATLMRLKLVDPNRRDENNETLLEQVIRQPTLRSHPRPGVVVLSPAARLRTLLDHGADPASTSTAALDIAVGEAKSEMIVPLAEAIASKGGDTGQALRYALRVNDVKMALDILKIKEKHTNGFVLLHAVVSGELARTITKDGADENFKAALIHAVLQEAGKGKLDVNARDQNGNTPLHKASTIEIAAALIAAGADVNARNEYGRTPLHTACTDKITELLISAGADINARDENDNTPQCTAAEYEIALKLSDAQADEHLEGAATPNMNVPYNR